MMGRVVIYVGRVVIHVGRVVIKVGRVVINCGASRYGASHLGGESLVNHLIYATVKYVGGKLSYQMTA